jgi:hypothetical protein
MKNKLLVIAAAAILSGFGVACGGSSEPAPEQAPAAEPTAGGEAAPAPEAAPAAPAEGAPAEAAPAGM